MMDWKDVLGWNEREIEDVRLLGASYLRQGVYDTALVMFEALAAIDPANPYDLQTLGALHLQQGEGMKALDYLDRALKLDPTDAKIKLNRAKALFMLGYRRQGLLEARELQSAQDAEVASQASALILAYSS